MINFRNSEDISLDMASSLLARSTFAGLRAIRFVPRIGSRVAARFMSDVSALEGTDDDLGTVVAREIAYEKVRNSFVSRKEVAMRFFLFE